MNAIILTQKEVESLCNFAKNYSHLKYANFQLEQDYGETGSLLRVKKLSEPDSTKKDITDYGVW